MRWLVRSIVATAALHLALPVVTAAADNAAPPEIKINPQSAAAATSAGISAETLDAVAKAIQAYGVAWDRGDEKAFRDTITGTPGIVDLAAVSMHAEQVQNAANQLAREKLSGVPAQAGTTQPAKRDPYTRTDYHRRVLAEPITIKGDNQHVALGRPSFKRPEYLVEKTPQGWRVLMSDEEFRGVPVEKMVELFNKQMKTYDQLREQIAAGTLKTWPEYAQETAKLRKEFRDALKAAAPTSAPAK